jgi:murE/murF fusion protein
VNSKIITLQIPLIGYYQVKNLLMAVLASTCCGIKINKAFDVIKNIKSVPGRLECISDYKNNTKIILDFAHTPEALKQSLIALKNQFRKNIILVFGCGGERDKAKRPRMGAIAKKYCRKIFVTDDNPRNENPKKYVKSLYHPVKN